MPITYKTPNNIKDASQLNPHYYERKALIEARKEEFFGQLASVKNMPKNSGTRIKQYHYIPILDDRNINDQGIDASGATYTNGNLYGSSKDVGLITNKLPLVGELGGRVNRVGFTRKEIEGTFQKFGWFYEYSNDMENFDSDADLVMHMDREIMNGAMQIKEAVLQVDLLNAANTVRYAGAATSNATLAEGMELTYQSLLKLGIDLDNKRTPKQTTIITGTRMIDTRTIPACRVAYVGSELIPTLEAMKDLHGEKALKPVQEYAAGTTVLNGEYGSIGYFRIVVVPEMLKWAGKGASATDAAYYATNGKYDVFPFLVVGDESFTTIGFQTDGKSQKFQIINKKAGKETADRNDPYGETSFTSMKWWYGFMPLRPERIGLIKCTAKM